MKQVIKHSGRYIGHTDAYYNDDDESVFTPDYYTDSPSYLDSDFATGEVPVELTIDGLEKLYEWRDEQRNNNLCVGYYGNKWGAQSYNQMCATLMSTPEYLVPAECDADAIHIEVNIPARYLYETEADIDRHVTFMDPALDAAYLNACDCQYYGDGRSSWQSGDITDTELLDFIWQTAEDTLAADYRY